MNLVTSLLIPFVVIIILILVNAMFVGAEFAIIGIRRSRLEQLKNEGNRTASWVYKIVSDPAQIDRYVATAQLGITLASLGLGMYAEPAIAHLIEEPLGRYFGLSEAIIHTIGFIIALTIITYLHVVLGEMIPKSLALKDAEKTVLALAAPMNFAEKLFKLPVRFLNQIGLFVLHLLRIPPPGEASRLYGPDELELIVSESYAGGMLEAYEHNLVSNIFDFSQLHADQVMTPRTQFDAIPINITEEELVNHFNSSNHTRLPVYEGTVDNIIGILHLKDLARQRLTGKPFSLRAMLRQVPYIPEPMPVETLLAAFRRQHVHMAIVLDEHGGTAGLVTLEDLIEEVVGEVRDEFDVGEVPPVVEVNPGELLVQGSVLLEDVQAYVDLGDLQHDVNTIGGLVVAKTGLPPQPGMEVSIGSAQIRVEEVNGLSIERVFIRFPADEES